MPDEFTFESDSITRSQLSAVLDALQQKGLNVIRADKDGDLYVLSSDKTIFGQFHLGADPNPPTLKQAAEIVKQACRDLGVELPLSSTKSKFKQG